jgi:hypothetical protein
LVLVSGRVTIPVGFRFYRPDPAELPGARRAGG